MGAIFIGGQATEYAELVREGITIPSSPYGSLFYLATGFHGLHVIGGLLAFLLVIGRTFAARKFTHEQADLGHRRVVLLALRRHRLGRPLRHDLHHPLTPRIGDLTTRLSWPRTLMRTHGLTACRKRHPGPI